MDNLCFIDCETTGLNPRRHVVWEIGLAIDNLKFEWRLELTNKELRRADAGALRVNGYYERRPAQQDLRTARTRAGLSILSLRNSFDVGGTVLIGMRYHFADYLAGLIGSRHLVGNSPTFDERFVGDFIRRYERVPAWHYHLIDTEALVAGKLRLPPPWKSAGKLAEEVGIDLEQFPRHTALGDALLAQAMYKAVMDDSSQQTAEVRTSAAPYGINTG